LAEKAEMSTMTVKRAEGTGQPPASEDAMKRLQSALEKAGVEFTNGGRPGVRMRKTPENAAELTQRIDTIEDDLAKTKGPSPQTPEGGMRTLERARKANVVTKLKSRRAKLKGHQKK
jgi:hypothetical protein